MDAKRVARARGLGARSYELELGMHPLVLLEFKDVRPRNQCLYNAVVVHESRTRVAAIIAQSVGRGKLAEGQSFSSKTTSGLKAYVRSFA